MHALRFAAFAAVVVTAAVRAQIWTQDPAFHPVLTNDVPALTSATFVPARDGRVLVFGRFTHLHGGAISAPGVAYLRPDGTPDETFHAEVGTTERIAAAVPLGDGRVLAVRQNADSTFAIIRFQTNGRLDPTFTPLATGDGITLTLQPDGRVLGWGNYVSVNGTYYNHLVRFNSDGAFDATFQPTGLTLQFVAAVAAQTDGKIIACGVGAPALSHPLIRLNTDGTLDTTFAPKPHDVILTSVAVEPDGRILASGLQSVDRFNVDGSADATFAPALSEIDIQRIAVRADGRILVQADVTHMGSTYIPTVLLVSSDGKNVQDVRTTLGANQAVQLACTLPDNSTWLIHGLPVFGYPTVPIELTPGLPSASATTSTAQSPSASGPSTDGTTMLMPTILPRVVPTYAVLSRLASDSTTVADIDPGVLARNEGNVGLMKLDAENRLTIEGQFTAIDGTPRSGLARFTPSGALDTTYSPALGNATLSRVLLFGSDGQLFATKTTLNDQPSSGVYGTTERVVHLRADGTTDTGFTPTIGFNVDTGWLAIGPDGRVLISYFTPDNNHEENLRLGWLDSTGNVAATLPTRFAGLPGALLAGTGTVTTGEGTTPVVPVSPTPVFPIVYGNPFSFARVLADGKILLGGMFERVNDQPSPRLVRLNADGSVDTTYAPDLSGFIGEPNVWLDAQGRVILSGQVLRGGATVSVLVRLLDNGARDPGYLSVPDVPADTLFRLENGLPDLNFPTQITKPDGTTARIVSALMAADGAAWTMNPLARFTAADVASITVDPTDRSAVSGRDTTFYVGLGTRDSATYQWLFDGAPIAGATLPYLPLTAVTAAQAGQYSVRVTVDGQSLTSAPATLTVLGGAVRLVNFSARAYVSADSSPIAGFVIAGDGTKRDWLLRAMGPTLAVFGVTDTLSDPELALFNGASEIAHDKGSANTPEIWGMANRVGAFPIFVPFPSPIWGNTESALVRTLSPGAYTASATSAGGNSGIVLLEVYDSIPGASGSLRNVSLRTRVGSGDRAATLGFVLVGNTPAKLLIRGIGPTLGAFGVQDTLADPSLAVFGSDPSSPLATNSGWANNADVANATHAAGAFALDAGSRDAALVVRLNPGAYTVQVKSAAAAIGNAMIEVYRLDQ